MRDTETKRPGGAGLRQVAERAGISVATASAVLSSGRSNSRFSSATRERVLQAAQDLRYQPNALARALTGQPTRTLGVLFGLERASIAVANPYISTVLQGIVAAAAEAHYNVTLFTEPWHNAAVSAGIVADRRTDGIIVIAPTMDSDLLSYLAEFDIPAVSIASPAKDGLAASVDVDNIDGARLATEHLLSLGHRRIAHISGDANLRSGVERRDSFLATMLKADVSVPPEYVVPGIYSPESGYEATLQLLSLPVPPTAIFAASDDIAQGVYRAAQEKDMAIPMPLSVVGFNDLPEGPKFEPPLTTIRQPLAQIGEEAGRMLLQRLQSIPVPLKAHLFRPTLVTRASTASPSGQSHR